MDAIARRKKKEKLPDIGKNIERYLRELAPGILGVQRTDSIEVLEMIPGAYNLNFHVRVNDREFIFRVNVEQQSGLPNQIEYEYGVLKFLEGHRIAPKAYHVDNQRAHFAFGILVEEYLEGPHLSLDRGEIQEVAELLVRLHALEPRNAAFVVWRDPLVDTYELAWGDMVAYEARRTAHKQLIDLAKEVFSRVKPLLVSFRHRFHALSMNHTDVVCDNIVKTSDGVRLIDWEKPRVDDCTYDICCFLCEPAQLWCSERPLTPERREAFLETYARLSQTKKRPLLEKVRVREPLVSLHWILWGATRLCDLNERRISPELLEAQEERVVRYERIANPDNIEKILGRL